MGPACNGTEGLANTTKCFSAATDAVTAALLFEDSRGGPALPTRQAMTIIDINGKNYEVHSVEPYFYAAGTVGNAKDLRGESLIVRQVRSKKFWLVIRYENGTYSKPIA